MTKEKTIKLVVLVGLLVLGISIYSIRSSVRKTPESVQERVKQVTSGARLSFADGEGARIEAQAGPVSEAQTVIHDFAFTNVGVIEAEIDNIEVIKGPVKVLDCSQRVLPSEEGEINVEFNPYGIQGEGEGILELHSNDVDYPVRELVLQVRVSNTP